MRALMFGALVLAFAGAAAAQPPPFTPAPVRPSGDVARDHFRHPAEIMAFAGVKPGDTVIEMIPGAGYYTRVLSEAVGPTGKVFAVIPTFLAQRFPKAVDAEKALAAEPGYGNVTVVVEGLHAITDQGPADVVFTAQNYHDLHNPAVPADTALQVDKAVLAALKPGGVFLVEDHVGCAGHRRDPGRRPAPDRARLRAHGDRLLRAGVRRVEHGGRQPGRPAHRHRVRPVHPGPNRPVRVPVSRSRAESIDPGYGGDQAVRLDAGAKLRVNACAAMLVRRPQGSVEDAHDARGL